jgi:transcriptional regulator with GAF, ATPase, and Fis domain
MSSVNENEFFREATIRLCSSLEIQQGVQDCMEYIKDYIPLSSVYLFVFDARTDLFQIIASASTEEQAEMVQAFHVPEHLRWSWKDHWAGCKIVNDMRSDPWLCEYNRKMGVDVNRSCLNIRIEARDTFALLSLNAKGQGVYTDEHARLMLLLKRPLAIAVGNALEHGEVLRLKDLLAEEHGQMVRRLNVISDNIVENQVGLREVMALCRQIAPLETPILLLGETGTGKDTMARIIHTLSPRGKGAFVSVNCGAVAETLLDSELFGHEKGAFTGAVGLKTGRFEQADKGTIFLDEIGELSPQGQVRLLHVLQYKEIDRVGGTRPIPVDTRIVAATNRDLSEMVKSGLFRKDLWFRLNVFPITIPPLRDRSVDIPELLSHFIDQKARELKLKVVPRVAPGETQRLMAYDWPGNVRELQNIVERALITARDGVLHFDAVVPGEPGGRDETEPARNGGFERLDQMNFFYIRHVLKSTQGKISGRGGAADILGIHPNTLRKRMDRLGITYKRAGSRG